MAFKVSTATNPVVTMYHSITYSSGVKHNGVASGVDMELLAPGDGVNDIKSILIANTHATVDATVSLFLQDDPTGAVTSTFYMLSTVAIPSDTSLLLDNNDMLSFDNGANGFGLYLTIGATDGTNTLDILIKR